MAKSIDLSAISIDKIIVHDIPKHKLNDLTLQPSYSENESELTSGLRFFFREKVVSALSSDKAFKICYDTNHSSPISGLISQMLTKKNDDFVYQTQAIAKHLFDIQIGINAAGILVAMFGKVSGYNACMILKLERDHGAQLTLDKKTNSFNIVEVQDLMLTQKTKIFKVAIFVLRDNFKIKYDGLIMDYQINIKEKREVSTYFIDKFLGCKAFEDPKVTTKRFFNLTRTFIDRIDDAILRTKYIQDLNSYMGKNNTMLNPQEFADDYLNTTSHRNAYKTYLESSAFNFSAFIKDNNLIDSKIKKIVLTFENDISIIGNVGTFEKKVKLEKMDNGQCRAQITSRIKNVS